MRLRLGGWMSWCALGAVLGCDAQVGEEYTGEPLLSLRGNVVLDEEQVNAKLVPHLAMFERDSTVFIPGVVSGEFPAKFRFDVMQPPPATAIQTEWLQSLGIEGGMVEGLLAMLPPDHRPRVPDSLETNEMDRQCSEDYSVCTHVERACDTDNRCRERLVECTERSCSLIETLAGTAWPPNSETDAHTSWTHCEGRTCDQVVHDCDAAGVCLTERFRCDPGPGGGDIVELDSGVMHSCKVLSESGDTSVMSLLDLQMARHFLIIYVTVDLVDERYGPLKRGYNLLVSPQVSNEKWLESVKCDISKTAEALAQYNAKGTQHGAPGADIDLGDLIAAVKGACNPYGSETLIERPLDQLLTLKLDDMDWY